MWNSGHVSSCDTITRANAQPPPPPHPQSSLVVADLADDTERVKGFVHHKGVFRAQLGKERIEHAQQQRLKPGAERLRHLGNALQHKTHQAHAVHALLREERPRICKAENNEMNEAVMQYSQKSARQR